MTKFFLFFLYSISLFSQQKTPIKIKFDSLEVVFFNNIYKNPQKAFLISKEAIKLTSNNNTLLCRSYQMSGISYLLLGKSDSSKYYFNKAIIKSKNLTDKKHFIKSVINYSNLEVDNVNNKELLTYIYQALDYTENNKKFNLDKGKLLMFISEISFNNKEYNKAEKEYKKALKFADSLLSSSIYRGLEAIEYKKKNYKEALNHAEKSILLLNDKNNINYTVSLLRVGRNYLKLKKHLIAEKHFLESKNLQLDIGIKSLKAETYLYLSEIERWKNNKNKELEFLKSAELASKNSNNYFQLKEVYLKLYNFHSRANNEQAEERFLNNYINLSDSLYNEEQNSLKLNIAIKYFVSQKEKEILFKDKLLKKEESLKLLFIISSIILFSLIIIIYLLLKKKNNTQIKLKEKELKLLLEKQKIEIIKEKIKTKNLERKEISKELHDGLANKICALKIILSDENDKTNKAEVIENIDLLYDEIRSLSHATMPNYISEVSFTDLIFDLNTKYKIQINTHFHQIEKLNSMNENIQFNIYRVLQESITNTIKYAKATKIDISLILLNGDLTITYEDNGIGFKKNIDKSIGIGLRNIESRILKLNGKHSIKSSSQGVEIEITIPINDG